MSDESRVIRAERRGPAVLRSEVYAAQLSAARIIAEAQAQAERLRAAAELECTRRFERAAEERERARAEAEARGYESGSARVAEELLSIVAARAAALRDSEREIERAVLVIARSIVGQAFEADPDLIANQIEPRLARLHRAQRVSVRLHPDDAARLEERRSDLTARAELTGVLEIIPDPVLARGDCTLESDVGAFDARIATRLDEIARRLGWEPA